MTARAAREWHDTYGIGERERSEITFRSARELIDFKARHGLKGETHADAILRTARKIAAARGVRVKYESTNPTMLVFYIEK